MMTLTPKPIRSLTRCLGSKAGTVTMPELMVVLVLFAFLTTGVFFFLGTIQTVIRQNQAQMAIMNQGRSALEAMVWGTEGLVESSRHGLWEARSLTLIDPQTLQFQGSDGNDRQVRLNGQNIEYVDQAGNATVIFDPNGAAADDTGTYAINVVFSQSTARVVDIELVLSRRVVGRWLNASLSTQVAIRNT